MAEAAEGRRSEKPADKRSFKKQEAELREALLTAQHDLKVDAKFPVIAIFAGMEGAGKGETVNVLNEWMDPRLIATRAYDPPTELELERPWLYRYWLSLPAKGQVGLLFGAWYGEPLDGAFAGEMRERELESALAEIVRHEQLLARDGALIVKFWLELSKEQQKKRLKTLARDPLTAWKVGPREREQNRRYGKFKELGEHVRRATEHPEGPWISIDGSDENERSLSVARILLDAVRARLDGKPAAVSGRKAKSNGADGAAAHGRARTNGAPRREGQERAAQGALAQLDLDVTLAKGRYERELAELQARFHLALRAPRFQRRHSIVAVFEGQDAAGKGGAIRRVTAALDARQYDVVPIAAPSDDERAQHYLYRFWRRLPRRGELTIFDRSWYGRVLVERVEKFAREDEWQRAYGEINDFESQLAAHGVIVVKFWLAISKDEQLLRFQERENTEWKNFKITPDDYRNRERWDAYVAAVNEMVQRTSTQTAPWTLVEANDKRYARVKVLRTLVEAVER